MDSYKYTADDIAVILTEKMKIYYSENVSYWKLQKLLYFSQGFTMAYKKRKLFDNVIIANRFGPICKDIFFDVEIKNRENVIELENELNDLLDDIVKSIGDFELHELEEFTYKDEAWMLSYKKGKNYPITDEDIKERFQRIIEDGL